MKTRIPESILRTNCEIKKLAYITAMQFERHHSMKKFMEAVERAVAWLTEAKEKYVTTFLTELVMVLEFIMAEREVA